MPRFSMKLVHRHSYGLITHSWKDSNRWSNVKGVLSSVKKKSWKSVQNWERKVLSVNCRILDMCTNSCFLCLLE
jgi:hypothetical protein